VQQHYLGSQAASTLLIVADSNRLAQISDWGLYELLLTALTEAMGQKDATYSLRGEFNSLRREAIISRDDVLTRRYLELALYTLCHEYGLQVCIILDEFDAAYRSVSAAALANLRALRDAHKYQLCYALVLREHPERLRPPNECEGFYELFSRSILGLKPYTDVDANRVIDQLVHRKNRQLSASARATVLDWSGGHPGMIVALFDILAGQNHTNELTWAIEQPIIQEECRKLWEGLADDERLALSHITHHIPVDNGLRNLVSLKGLTRSRDGIDTLFSPLFAQFVLTQGAPVYKSLWIDEAARVVWMGSQPVKGLTAREFDLLIFLYHHLGHVCTRDQILAYLYPDDKNNDVEDNRVDTLIKRVREKVEPVRNHPRYILTIRGKGYRLVDTPDLEGG
jgi:hypothetical protein